MRGSDCNTILIQTKSKDAVRVPELEYEKLFLKYNDLFI